MLKSKKNKVLSQGKDRKRDIWAEVAEYKIKKIKLEMKILEEEWELRREKMKIELEKLKQN